MHLPLFETVRNGYLHPSNSLEYMKKTENKKNKKDKDLRSFPQLIRRKGGSEYGISENVLCK